MIKNVSGLLLRSVGMPAVLAFGLSVLASTSAFAAPLGFLPKTERNFLKVDKVILETEDGYLYRLPEATDKDFENLYWVNLSDSLYDRLSIETLGEVVLMSEGRFAVLDIAPEKVPEISAVLHDERAQCGHLMKLNGDEISLARARKVASPIIPVSEPISVLPSLQAQVSPDTIEKLVEEMSSLTSRHATSMSAKATTDLLVSRYSAFNRPGITVSTFPHKAVPKQPSVIVRIEGTTRPDEVVVIGSHIDSIAIFSLKAPGADDNASGTASHFEVMRIIAENNLRFERTIEIHGYAAEELGLVGSQDIARQYAAQGVNVVAMLQNDMNLYRAGSNDVIWLITNGTDARLTNDVAKLAGQYQTVELNQGRLTAGSSDHAAWTRQGVPTVFPTENPTAYNRSIHTSNDTIANSGYFTQSAEFSKLTLSFLAHFAGLVP